MMPLLQAQGSEATVRGLAVLLVADSITAACWVGSTWPGEDWSHPDHPSKVIAGRDPNCPGGRVRATLSLLLDACMRHTALTGQDGVELAEAAVHDHLGPAKADLAALVLLPLTEVRHELGIEGLLMPSPPSSYPAPSEKQRRVAEKAMVDHVEAADARLDGLPDVLNALADRLRAVDGGEPDAAAREALAVVEAFLRDAFDAGIPHDTLQQLVNLWSDITPGAPRINLDSSGAGSTGFARAA